MVPQNHQLNASSQFLAIAHVQAHLFAVKEISERVSLSAKNAKAIAARAGSQALGFHPITDFIDKVAIDITALVDKVNGEALALSSMAIAQLNSSHCLEKLKEAKSYQEQPNSDIESLILTVTANSGETKEDYQFRMKDMMALLDEIKMQLQAAEMICTTSRTEATRAGEFQENLESVSDQVSTAVIQLKDILSESRLIMNDYAIS